MLSKKEALSSMSLKIYHEKQESNLCGQHALNNVLQIPGAFTPVSLSEIANKLDEQEKSMGLSNFTSQNVDASGNFSVQVLSNALSQGYKMNLVNWNAESERDRDVLNEQGLILNRMNHWLAIRKIKDKWWNLDSTLPHPQFISDFYLSSLIAQMRADGFTIFLVDGLKPIVTTSSSNTSNVYSLNSFLSHWHTEEELLKLCKEGSNGTGGGQPKPFGGKGRRLGGDTDVIDVDTVSSNDMDADTLAAIRISQGLDINGSSPDLFGGESIQGLSNEADTDLALAISLSMASAAAEEKKMSNPQDPPPNSKEAIRAARLAALEKRRNG